MILSILSLTLYTFSPNIDPQMKIARYKRTKADNEVLGLSQVYHCCIRMLWIWSFFGTRFCILDYW